MDTASEIPRFPGRIVEVAGPDLEFKPVGVPDATPTGRQILAYCDRHPYTDYVVLQWLPGGDLEEVRPEEQVDMSDAAAPRLIVARSDRLFRFQLNDRTLDWPVAGIGEAELRKLGRVPADQSLVLRREDGDRPVPPGASVDLGRAGVEVIYAQASKWRLNVQGVMVESAEPEITVRDAMLKAGFDIGTAWIIVLKTAVERRQVGLDHLIDLRLPGIEKLRLTPREINNGEAPARPERGFALLAADEAGLDERRVLWRTMFDGGRRWLLLDEVRLPPGFNVASVCVAIEVPGAYPAAELDMFYCHPRLMRLDGREIPQTQVDQAIAGRTFQRWSRHRGAMAPWRPGRDSVLTHLALIDAALTREVEL